MDLDALSSLLIALAVFDWASTAVIYLAARKLHEPALDERASVSVILSLAATGAACLGAARLGFLTIPPGVGIFVLSLILILLSIPQLVWIVGLFTGKFR